VKELVVFDLDGTLAESKSAVDAEMAALLAALLDVAKVAVISGGDWPQFEQQLLSNLPHDDRLKRLCLLPTCGTKITFSALGQRAPIEEKKKWDPDFTKRKQLKAQLDQLIPEFSVRLGGTTSVDVTKPGIDKAYGIRKLRETLGIAIPEMIFVGDALFPGGNDHPAKEAGVVSICVSAHDGVDFVNVDNKDASLFPVPIPNHAGKLQLAMLHRPLFPGTRPEETAFRGGSPARDVRHESIWISYCPLPGDSAEPRHFGLFNSHHRLATPVSPWERLKIGGGTPPVLTRHGWLVLYHGVQSVAEPGQDGHQLCYSAGAMVLSKEHPRVLRYRSAEPVLRPELPHERQGTIANVVFPTGIDARVDLGLPDRFDVYYGMADNRIGVARLDLPEHLPVGARADCTNEKSDFPPTPGCAVPAHRQAGPAA